MHITEVFIDLTSPLLAMHSAAARDDRIEATARLGAMMPPGLAVTNPAAALSQICARTIAALSPKPRMKISIAIDDGISLPPPDIARLGLIVSELLTNAIVHAHPTGVFGEIIVRCDRRDGAIVLEVCDDGIGMPEHFDPERDCGVGLRVVRAVAHDIGASVRFNSGGCGLNAVVLLPGAASSCDK